MIRVERSRVTWGKKRDWISMAAKPIISVVFCQSPMQCSDKLSPKHSVRRTGKPADYGPDPVHKQVCCGHIDLNNFSHKLV